MLEYIAFITLALGSIALCYWIVLKISNTINAFSKWLEKRAYEKACCKKYDAEVLRKNVKVADPATEYRRCRNEAVAGVIVSVVCPAVAPFALPLSLYFMYKADKIENEYNTAIK